MLRLREASRTVVLWWAAWSLPIITASALPTISANVLPGPGIKSYVHYLIDGYPHSVDLIASDEGSGKNDYIETERPLVIVTAPGPGSGKMAVRLAAV